MAESLWLAVCSRRDSLAPLIVSRRVDDDGLQAFAAELGASDPSIVEVWLYPLAAEKVVTFKGPVFGAMVKEHQERAELARLKAKYEPVSAVAPDRGYRVPSGSVITPEGLVGPEFDANGDRVLRNGMKLPDRAGSIDGADYLAQLLRWFRPRLSAGSALTAALTTGLDPSVDYSPTAAALRLLADRASEIDADIAAVRGLAQ